MSQTDLGAPVGVSYQQIQKYERAANRVSASTLWECAQALDAPIQTLFDARTDLQSGNWKTELSSKALRM